jgi:hypothetical protein
MRTAALGVVGTSLGISIVFVREDSEWSSYAVAAANLASLGTLALGRLEEGRLFSLGTGTVTLCARCHEDGELRTVPVCTIGSCL